MVCWTLSTVGRLPEVLRVVQESACNKVFGRKLPPKLVGLGLRVGE